MNFLTKKGRRLLSGFREEIEAKKKRLEDKIEGNPRQRAEQENRNNDNFRDYLTDLVDNEIMDRDLNMEIEDYIK